MKDYHDIINLPRHVSTKRKPMPIINRAAQFAPFAALNGHEEAIKERGRRTELRINLDTYKEEEINRKLVILMENIKREPEIQIEYFIQDRYKEGGSYVDIGGPVNSINQYKKIIYMKDGTKIPINEIINLEGQIFKKI